MALAWFFTGNIGTAVTDKYANSEFFFLVIALFLHIVNPAELNSLQHHPWGALGAF